MKIINKTSCLSLLCNATVVLNTRNATATTNSEGARPGRTVRSQEPKERQTSLGGRALPIHLKRLFQGRRVTPTQSSVKAFSEGWIRANEWLVTLGR
jgi:hypothetical protein